MAIKEKKGFSLLDLPDYDYSATNLACPECFAPVQRGRVDGRCDDCLKSKKVLPVNYRRPPRKKKDEDTDEAY